MLFPIFALVLPWTPARANIVDASSLLRTKDLVILENTEPNGVGFRVLPAARKTLPLFLLTSDGAFKPLKVDVTKASHDGTVIVKSQAGKVKEGETTFVVSGKNASKVLHWTKGKRLPERKKPDCLEVPRGEELNRVEEFEIAKRGRVIAAEIESLPVKVNGKVPPEALCSRREEVFFMNAEKKCILFSRQVWRVSPTGEGKCDPEDNNRQESSLLGVLRIDAKPAREDWMILGVQGYNKKSYRALRFTDAGQVLQHWENVTPPEEPTPAGLITAPTPAKSL